MFFLKRSFIIIINKVGPSIGSSECPIVLVNLGMLELSISNLQGLFITKAVWYEFWPCNFGNLS